MGPDLGDAVGRLRSEAPRHGPFVPHISAFHGIVIEMYFGDHSPPHFHARYGGDVALIVIATGDVYAGRFHHVP